MSKNLLIHRDDIDGDFTSLYFALYMKGEYGVEVGYNTMPEYLANMRKMLCDYQVLSSLDCNNELFIASQGSLVYDCCSSGSTRVTASTQTNCCPVGYIYSAFDGLCHYVGIGSRPTESTVPCPCCPDGYTYISATGLCRGVSASDTTDPIDCLPRCVDGYGQTTAFIQCTDRVPDSTIISYPVGDSNVCGWDHTTPYFPIPVIPPTPPSGSTLTIQQFAVGDANGPVAGQITFLPTIGGASYLINKTVTIAMRVLLVADADYSFDKVTGRITLLSGREFNLDEVYTIFSY